MEAKNELSRITIDMPKVMHKKLKAIAALNGKSMRDVVIEAVEQFLHTSHKLNEETRRVIEDIKL